MKNYQHRFAFLSLIGLCLIINVSSIWAQTKIFRILGQPVFSDSLLQKFTADDLLRLESVLDRQLDSSDAVQTEYCSKMIDQGVSFIENDVSLQYKPLVLKQLGDLYMLYAEKMEIDANRHSAFNRVKYYYTELMVHYPGHNATGNAFFSLAELTVTAGEDSAAAIPFLRRLILDYPENGNIPAAYFWLAEDIRKNQHDNAAALAMYRHVLKYPEAPEYLPSFYHLAELSYSAENYPECIDLYSKLLQAMPREGFYLSGRHVRLLDLEVELKPVLARVFIAAGGIESWEKWHDEYDWANYSFDILAEMGYEWLHQENAGGALAAFKLWVKHNPMADNAPVIFTKLIQAAEFVSTDDVSVFDLRKTIVHDYGPESDWWQAVADDYRDQARPLIASACRENIQWLELQGVARQDKRYFEQTAVGYLDYFRLFPQDSSRARLSWNYAQLLENKLILPDSAYTEYLRISDDFWDSAYQRPAIERAIQVAAKNLPDADLQNLIQYPRELILTFEPVGLPRVEVLPSVEAQVLSKWEQRYQAAIDVYIMLYPHDLETAEKLLSSSIISFLRGYPGRAQKYAQTMNYYFPHSSLADVARVLGIECDFRRLVWPETIAECRRIMLREEAGDLSNYASQRFAEASYLQALALADSGKPLKAAASFASIATFVPEAVFADVALLKAGKMYTDSQEYRRALSMFSRLMQQYEKSENYIEALNGSISCYEKMQQYRNAAVSSERLAKIVVDSLIAADALRTAGRFYEKAEKPVETIRVYLEHAERFPTSENTPFLLLAAGELALANQKISQARGIFVQLADQYPFRTASVAANFYLGKSTSEPDSVKYLYARAFTVFETLPSDDKDLSAKFAADALLGFAQIENNELQGQLKNALPDFFAEVDTSMQSIGWAYGNAAKLAPQRRFEIAFQEAMAGFTISQTISAHIRDWRSKKLPIEQCLKIADYAIQMTEKSFDRFVNNLAYLVLFLPDSLSDSDPHETQIVMARQWQYRNREKVFQVLAEQVELKQLRLDWELEHALKKTDHAINRAEKRFQIFTETARPLAQEIRHNIDEGVRLSRRWQVETKDTRWLATQQVAANEWYPKKLWLEIHETIRLWQHDFEEEALTHFWEDGVSRELEASFAVFQQYAAPETVAAQYNSLVTEESQLTNFVKNACLLSAELDTTILLVQSESVEQQRLHDVLEMDGAHRRLSFCRKQLIAKRTFKNNWLRTAESVYKMLPDSAFWKKALRQELIYTYPDEFYTEPLAVDSLEIDSSWFVSTENSAGWRYPLSLISETRQLAVIDSLSEGPHFWLMEDDPDTTANEKKMSANFILRREFSGHDRPVNLNIMLHSTASLNLWLNGENIQLKMGIQENEFFANIFSNLLPGRNILVIELEKANSVLPSVAGEFVLSYLSHPRFSPPLWRSQPYLNE